MHPRSTDFMLSLDLGPAATTVRTSSAQLAHSQLQSYLTLHRMDVRDDTAELAFFQQHTFVGALKLSLLTYGAKVTIATPGLPDFFLFQITLKGVCRIEFQDAVLALPGGSMFVMNPGEAYEKHWSSDAVQLLIKVPAVLLEPVRSTGVRSSSRTPRALRFGREIHQVTGSGAALYRLVEYICHDLCAEPCLAHHPKVQDEFERCVVVALLATFVHSNGAEARSRQDRAVPYYVHRAETFMKMHAAEPLTLSDLARAAGVSARTLELGFRQARRQGPLACLRELRLQRAHALITDAPVTGCTVTQTATLCGFSHFGRFSQVYREHFGVLPSHALREALRGQKSRS